MPSIDWSNDEQRKQFENDIQAQRDNRRKYSWWQWLLWFSGVILLPAMLVFCFYGPVGYSIVNDQRKIDTEESGKRERQESRNASITEELVKNHVDYNDTILSTIKRNFYFLTLPCQGLAFLSCVAFHYTDYKLWNLLGGLTALLCLPIDILIFYLEPLGFVGTLVAMVLGFVPFAITIADAVYVEKEVKIKGLKGKIFTIRKNSWTKHLSLSYNERYNLVLRMTGTGYTFFSTVALLIQVFQGD